MEEKWLAASFTGSPFHLFMNLSHVGFWCLRNTTKYLDTSITVNPHSNLCCHFGWEVTSSGRPNVWPEFSQCQGRELGLSIRITSKRAGCSARPGSSPLTLSTTRKPCQALFLAQAKGLPPFHRALHHCRNNLEFSAVFFFLVMSPIFSNPSQGLSAHFPKCPVHPEPQRPVLVWFGAPGCPRHFPDWRTRDQGWEEAKVCIHWMGKGGRSPVHWASGITGPAPSTVSGGLLLIPCATRLYGNTSA